MSDERAGCLRNEQPERERERAAWLGSECECADAAVRQHEKDLSVSARTTNLGIAAVGDRDSAAERPMSERRESVRASNESDAGRRDAVSSTNECSAW